jgi:hypothetical protein
LAAKLRHRQSLAGQNASSEAESSVKRTFSNLARLLLNRNPSEAGRVVIAA